MTITETRGDSTDPLTKQECPTWCFGCRPDSDGPHMSPQRLVELTMEEPSAFDDTVTGRRYWYTPKVGVCVLAERGHILPYLSLAVGDEEVSMTFGQALELLTALEWATDEVVATFTGAHAARQAEAQEVAS